MKVIVDDKIPYISEAIESIADEVVYASGELIDNAMVKDADALIIRTRTHCDEKLLAGSNVRFIATATIGYDHIDTAYCRKAGIVWKNAPGSNASSVAQYIESCMVLLEQNGYTIQGKTIGIIGVGNVGKKIEILAQQYGMNVLPNDPPREEAEGGNGFVSLDEIAQQSDIITFHTPLYIEGKYKTYHLANGDFFSKLRKKPVIINTSRGEVIETSSLINALEKKIISDAIIDVWEKEPFINKELLNKALIATPHIAGYSADGKANATRMSLQALCEFFQLPFHYNIQPPALKDNVIRAHTYQNAILKIYNPENDSELLKDNPANFEWFRGHYPVRREKEAYQITIIP